MREFDALREYPQPKQPRHVSPDLRTIHSRIIASYRDREYYDGDRNNGYGGFKYDGRWVPIAKHMCKEYGLDGSSAVLQIGCEKGFLLHDFHELHPTMKVRGTEISKYVIENAMPSVKQWIQKSPFTKLPFDDEEFDFVIAIGVVYTLTLADAIQCLKEIQRVGKGKSFITLGSYRTEEEFRLFRYWTVLGCTILREDEWIEVLKHVGYTGDYKFTTVRSLNLIEMGGSRSKNNYRLLWESLEKRPQPRYVRQVKIVDFTGFEKKVYEQSDSFVQEIVTSLYAGDAYILRNALPLSFIRRIKNDLCNWWDKEKPSFHKMMEGVPDHHRIADESSAGKYGLESIRHSHYFFPFNDDPFKVFETVNKLWRMVKFLGGFSKTEYEKNTPKDGVIDRAHFIHYPAGTGKMELHSDPFLNQRVFTGCILSKRGIDYQKGGVYLVDENHQKVDFESVLEVGDLYIAYPTLYHGVDLVDGECVPNWQSPLGRWFLGLYSNDSDMVEKRHTVYGASNIIKLKEGPNVVPSPIFLSDDTLY